MADTITIKEQIKNLATKELNSRYGFVKREVTLNSMVICLFIKGRLATKVTITENQDKINASKIKVLKGLGIKYLGGKL